MTPPLPDARAIPAPAPTAPAGVALGAIPDTTSATGGDFPPTRWTLLLAARDRADPAWRVAMGALCTDYWQPVYHYVCAAWGAPDGDARDLTQEFFARLLEGDPLAAVAPERGRFRHFLKAALRHFLLNERRDARRRKRGGGVPVLPLGAEEAGPPAPGLSPEEALDRAWAAAVLDQAGRRLRASLAGAGQDSAWEAFRLRHLAEGPGEPPAYDEIARRLGLSRFDVGNLLKLARAEYRRHVLAILRDGAADEEEARRELFELFEGDGP